MQNYLNGYLATGALPEQPGLVNATCAPVPTRLDTDSLSAAGRGRAARLAICCALGSARIRRGCWTTATGRRRLRSAPLDPVANVFVESRIRAFGLDPGRLGAQMWGFEQGGRLVSLCYGGANLVPVQATSPAIAAFADRALRQGRRCSSIVGTSAAVSELWGFLRPYWGPARDVRAAQPLMAIDGPSPVAAGPRRQARPPR